MGEKTEEGICLFHRKKGEKDLECSVFSPESGLIYVKIVSALKGSKLYFPMCSTSRLYLASSSRASFYILKDLTVQKVRDSIVLDYEKFSIYSLLSKVLIYFGSYDRESSYNLFLKASDAINDGVDPYLIFAYTVEQFFVNQGVSGDYSECPHCGKQYEKDEVIGYSDEHFCSCCNDCASVFNVLSYKMRIFLGKIQSLDFDGITRINTDDIDLYRLSSFECFRLKHLSKKHFNDIDNFLKSIKREREGVL